MSGAQGLLPTKSQKGRRKISLPWFRQNSVSSPHAGLSRQHTIDSPGSFRFFRQSSNNFQVDHFSFISAHQRKVTVMILELN